MKPITALDILRCECGHGRRLHQWTNPVRGACTADACACIGYDGGEYVAALAPVPALNREVVAG